MRLLVIYKHKFYAYHKSVEVFNISNDIENLHLNDLDEVKEIIIERSKHEISK